MMETSRDDEHKEDVVLRLMFEMLCKGGRWEMRRGHRRRRPTFLLLREKEINTSQPSKI
jgi:hypothetical protein